MYRALYRTWRPQTFDDVCGQGHITDILKYQVASGKTSHAYLFCGSRGTGKTTCAKILAKAVNCLHPVNGNPCNTCEACRAIDAGTTTDVIEMDAASNNGVDHVRDLKEEIVYLPSTLKYRVYIIDEVHMMSTGAFNALLKTLEEPPSYVLFILATTELHKLPATIISRCQRYDFRRIATDVIIGRLSAIAEAEGMTLLPDGARVIARAAQGGMRDAVSMLELCAGAHAPIDEGLAASVLGVGNRETVFRVARAIGEKDYETLYRVIDDIVMSSGNLGVFWRQLGDLFRDMMVYLSVPNAKEYLDLTDTEATALAELCQDITIEKLYYRAKLIDDTMSELQRSGVSRRAAAEIALIRMCDPRTYRSPEAMLARLEELERMVKRLQLGTPVVSEQPTPPATPKMEETPVVEVPSVEPTTPKTAPKAAEDKRPIPDWREISDEFGTMRPSYTAIVAGSRGYVAGDKLYVKFVDQFVLAIFRSDEVAKQELVRLTNRIAGTAFQELVIDTLDGTESEPDEDENMF